MRLSAVTLAALLALAACSPVSGGYASGVPATTPVVSEADTAGYLALPPDDIRTKRVGTATMDVSSALAADAGRLRATFTRRWLNEAYADAETDDERRLVLARTAERVATRIDGLHTRERRALEEFNTGERSTREYLRELAVVDARADALRNVVRQLETRADRMENSPVTNARFASFEAQLLPLRGPVRDRIGRTLTGERNESLRVYVATSSDGFVLATVVETDEGMQYVREAYLPGARNPNAENQFDGSLEEVLGRFSELYPWAANHTAGSISVGRLEASAVYPVTIPHSHGRIEAYLDGGTNELFLEYQRERLSQVPTDPPTTETRAGLRLQVNRTRVGGPVEFRVMHNITGDPVDARVLVDGDPVGRTGADGRLWTVAPPARFTVDAVSTGYRVSTTVSPTANFSTPTTAGATATPTPLATATPTSTPTATPTPAEGGPGFGVIAALAALLAAGLLVVRRAS